MEEFLVILIQFIVEIGIQWLIYMPFDITFERNRTTGASSGCGWIVLLIVAGGLLGWISVLIAPNLILPTAGWRIANLSLAPIVVGGASYWVAQGRKLEGSLIKPMDHFWFGLLFTLSLAAVRLAYGAA